MKKLTLVLLVCVLLILMGVQTVSADPCCRVIHIVRRGENLYRIALRYGTTVNAIARANGIANPNRIYAGQRLCIPTGWAPPPPSGGRIHIVRYGETLSGIARWYGVSMWAIMRANGITNANRIYAGQRLVIPRGGGGWRPPPSHGFSYTVRWGDSLAGIARRFGVNMWSIVSANHIANPNVIYVGQRLWIP